MYPHFAVRALRCKVGGGVCPGCMSQWWLPAGPSGEWVWVLEEIWELPGGRRGPRAPSAGPCPWGLEPLLRAGDTTPPCTERASGRKVPWGDALTGVLSLVTAYGSAWALSRRSERSPGAGCRWGRPGQCLPMSTRPAVPTSGVGHCLPLELPLLGTGWVEGAGLGLQ